MSSTASAGSAGKSPFLNTRRGVGYVAERECERCHAEIAASFRQHAMGQSLEPVQAEREIARAPLPTVPVHAKGFQYVLTTEENRLLLREDRLNAAGEVVLSITAPLTYAVGAGEQGRSYLIERDERLFMAPVTWYPQRQRWELSPGYETNNSHFYRPVVEACLFCHSGEALNVPHSRNRYRPPIFPEHAIGCQRCHGPGELHVRKHDGTSAAGRDEATPSANRDVTIVNPVHLSDALALDVCAQCHLAGAARVTMPGQSPFDFRPGLPLSETLVVFEHQRSDAHGAKARFVGHVEQMQESGCFLGTKGKLRCTSCHDPHRSPTAEQKAGYFRARCLTCHEKQSPCSEQDEVRAATKSADNCVECHMPALQTEIQHAATTDHRVPRRPANAAEEPQRPRLLVNRLVPFDNTVRERPGFPWQRNLGMAQIVSHDHAPTIPSAAEMAETSDLLEQAVLNDPDDVAAREGLAVAYERRGLHVEAADQFQRVLSRAPQREFSLAGAARNLAQQRRFSAAAGLWQQAVELNPWLPDYRAEWALCLARQDDWAACERVSRDTLVRFPESLPARQLHAESLLAQGKLVAAEQAFAELVRLDPPGIETLRTWWEQHPLRKLP
jgi:predicted CXXCH cytochrome family protein